MGMRSAHTGGEANNQASNFAFTHSPIESDCRFSLLTSGIRTGSPGSDKTAFQMATSTGFTPF